MIEFKIGDRVKWPGGWEGVITEIGVGPWAAEGVSDDGHRLWAGHLSQLSPIASPEATSREQRGVSGVEARRGWQTAASVFGGFVFTIGVFLALACLHACWFHLAP